MNESLRLDLTLKTALTETTIVHVYAVFDQQIEITKLRDVIPDYTS